MQEEYNEKEGGMLLCSEEERLAQKDHDDLLALAMG